MGREDFVSDRMAQETELVRAYLMDLPRDDLVALTVELAQEDRGVWTYLVGCARLTDGPLDVREMKKELTRAFRTGGFVDYRRAAGYADRAGAAVDIIRMAFDAGHVDAVIELCEHAAARLDTALNHVDDSAGYLGVVRDDVQELHRRACIEATPDPVKLGRRLCDIALRSTWEWFLDGPISHRAVLGDEGLRAYRRRLEPEWEKVGPLAPGDERWGRSEPFDRFRITHLRENLARAEEDVDDLVEVMARDLSLPYSFVQIAGVLDGAGREREAVGWLERGMREFPPDGRDERLRRALVDAYLRDGQVEDAIAVADAVFDAAPGAATYLELHHAAGGLPDWEARRARAFDVLRERGAGEGRGALVRILIGEGRVEDAWREAVAGGCAETLWLELADLRRTSHPDETLPVYLRHLDRALGFSDVRNYAEVVRLLERIEEAHHALGEEAEFAVFLAALRTEQRRRTKLIRMIAQRWPS